MDLSVNVNSPTSTSQLNEIFKKYTNHENMVGVLDVTDQPLVSVDFMHNPHSSIVDISETYVTQKGTLCRVLSWYDNEWGFSIRMLDIAKVIATL